MQNNGDLAYIPFSDNTGKRSKSAAVSPSGKKSKLALILISILGGIILILSSVLIYLYATGFFEPEPVAELSDADFLTSVSGWEKLGAPTVIWTFSPDGTGELTTNKSNYYKTTWTLSDKTLNISTSWLYLMDDSFSFSINRDDNSFTVQNLSTNTVSVFIPLGSENNIPADSATAETEPATDSSANISDGASAP